MASGVLSPHTSSLFPSGERAGVRGLSPRETRLERAAAAGRDAASPQALRRPGCDRRARREPLTAPLRNSLPRSAARPRSVEQSSRPPSRGALRARGRSNSPRGAERRHEARAHDRREWAPPRCGASGAPPASLRRCECARNDSNRAAHVLPRTRSSRLPTPRTSARAETPVSRGCVVQDGPLGSSRRARPRRPAARPGAPAVHRPRTCASTSGRSVTIPSTPSARSERISSSSSTVQTWTGIPSRWK